MAKTVSGKESVKDNATTRAEPAFFYLLTYHAINLPVKEHMGIPGRKYRFDYAWLTEKVAVEIQGGVYTKHAHGSITGILAGYRKANECAKYGWRVLYFTPAEMKLTDTVKTIKAALEWKEPKSLRPKKSSLKSSSSEEL
jgi:very-short-patch-repair endonuclease